LIFTFRLPPLSHACNAVIELRNDVTITDHDLAKIVFLNLLASVQPTIQTVLNGITLFDAALVPRVSERILPNCENCRAVLVTGSLVFRRLLVMFPETIPTFLSKIDDIELEIFA